MTPLQRLNEMERQAQLDKLGNDPYKIKIFGMLYDKHSDKTERGLIKAIEAWFKFHGGLCRRINTMGRYLPGKTISKGFYGNVNTKGKYIPTTSVLGAADLSIIKNKISWELEIKIGTDRQSQVQKEYQKKVEAEGSIYTIVHNFDEFIEQYNKIFPSND